MGVQAGGQDASEDGISLGLDAKVAGREAPVEAVAMATPGGGSAVAQGPVGLQAAGGRGFLRTKSDSKVGGSVQRMGRVGFAFDQAFVETGVGGAKGGDGFTQGIGLGA